MDDDGRRTPYEIASDVATRAHRRDRAAWSRDARARSVDEALAADPAAYDAKEVARLAARDRRAAEDDRAAAAADCGVLIHALLAHGRTRCDARQPPDLRPRELDVLVRLADGMTSQEIGDDLFLSINTVKTHTRNLYRKLGVRTRVAAANWARDHGYGRPPVA
ncbi:MAG TPA: response regulator transcription factor [Iamia sp.]